MVFGSSIVAAGAEMQVRNPNLWGVCVGKFPMCGTHAHRGSIPLAGGVVLSENPDSGSQCNEVLLPQGSFSKTFLNELDLEELFWVSFMPEGKWKSEKSRNQMLKM